MKSKTKGIIILAMLTSSLLLLAPVKANGFPNLPTDPVTLTLTVGPTLEDRWPGSVVFEGIDESADPAYDVENNLPYTAWCAQFDNFIAPDTPYEAILTVNPAFVEAEIWNKINWLLNQGYAKNQAVQFAIWLLLGITDSQISARYTGATNAALLAAAIGMVAAANADPESENFVPSAGQTIAVYCDVTDYYDDTLEEAQDVIIELEIPITREPGLSPGFWKHNVGVYLGERNGAYSDPVGSPVVSQATMGEWLAGLGLDLEALYDELNTKGGGAEGAATRVGAANVFNDLAGLADYMD